MDAISPPQTSELEEVFRLKYGPTSDLGPGPRRRWRFGYFTPDDYYEALLYRLVQPGCKWLDVGCGRGLFPSNERLARLLAERCGFLLGVDPDATLEENPFVHQKLRGVLDDYSGTVTFDLASLRMVAEHVDDPRGLAGALSRCVRRGGLVVIYTVNRFSPVPLLTPLVPFSLRHPLKRWLWRTEKRDTFPTRFRMNTRRRLANLLTAAGFQEVLFMRLDDCRTLQRFTALTIVELSLWKVCRVLGLPYPEHCLLGVYAKS